MTTLLRDTQPALQMGAMILPSEVLGLTNSFQRQWYVDGDNGSDSNTGQSPNTAVATIQHAVTLAAVANSADNHGARIWVKGKSMAATATDPTSYAETVIIPADGGDFLEIVGVNGENRTQGGLPQIKKGSGTAALITVRAPGVGIYNLGINGSGSTGGGILFDDDSGTSKTAFGFTVANCHLKNCTPSTALDSSTGGAIFVKNAWQGRIAGNRFYKNVGGVTMTSPYSDVNDIIIEDNMFNGPASVVDTYIYYNGAGTGISVRGNTFASAIPSLSSAVNARYVLLTGAIGIFSDNYVAGSYTTTGFGAAGAAALIPTTVGIAHNYSDAGLIVRQ